MTRPPRPGENEAWAGWDLSGLVVDQVVVDYRLALHMFGRDRGFSLTLITPFTYRPARGEPVVIEPEEADAVLPVALAVLRRPAVSFQASSLGRCVLRFEGGAEIAHGVPDLPHEAWESGGDGPLKTARLLAGPGPGSPWGGGPPPSGTA